MNPITGPFLRQVARNAGGTVIPIRFNESKWYRQKKPYNLPLSYYNLQIDNVAKQANGPLNPSGSASASFNAYWRPYVVTDDVSGDPYVPSFTSLINQTLSKALSRFNDKRGEAAALGVSLAQGKMAIDMIANRLTQGWELIRALRKLELGKAAKLLGIKRSTFRKRARGLSGLQLEISFGWMPMIADVQDAVKVLNGPLPYGLAKGSASIDGVINANSGSNTATHKVKVKAYVAAHLLVTNPGMDVAQRLGLTDPLPVIYELVPWSFVANWVLNLEEFIGQYNGYLGVSVINPHYGVRVSDRLHGYRPNVSNPIFSVTIDGVGESFRRYPGSLPGIRLGLRPSVSMPVQRALNAISLLVQKGIKSR